MKSRNIIDKIDRESKDGDTKILDKEVEYDKSKVDDLMEKIEIEKNKSESQKRHEHYLRQIKRMASEPDLNVRPAKKIKTKPGLEFEGPLKVLAKKYKDIEVISQHMTFGQLNKYYEKDNMLYRHKDNMLVYNPQSGECYE